MIVNVVVDIQTYFVFATETEYLARVVALIEEARGRGEFIVVVECDQCGPTHRCIRDALAGYEQAAYVSKPTREWDGSASTQAELNKRGIVPDSFVVWGVYSEQCVLFTVEGLLGRFPCNISVKKDACMPCQRMDWDSYAGRTQRVTLS